MSEVVEPSAGSEVVENPESPSEGQPNVGELIAESKKYRGRAQTAEAELAEIKEAQKKAEEAKLAEQGEYKTLLEQKEAELESATNKASEWDNYQTSKKEKILEGMTEAQAEKYKGLDLKTLESIAEDLKLNSGAGKAPSDRPGNSQSGQKFNGHETLPAWAAHAVKAGGDELDKYRNRNGDYPR